MAAALAKVIRGGRSGASAQLLLPTMGHRILLLGVHPHLGSSSVAPAAGMGRLMHTGQWCNSGPSGGTGSKLAELKALLLGRRGELSQNQKHVSRELGKRFMCNGLTILSPGLGNLPWGVLCILYVTALVYTFPITVRSVKKLIRDE